MRVVFLGDTRPLSPFRGLGGGVVGRASFLILVGDFTLGGELVGVSKSFGTRLLIHTMSAWGEAPRDLS